ncbi:cation:proton antiporter [Saxibacter everestensis]|uniref:Cation:proton antiporter n=1 Tax=Saxibacter everestensis TaxID=2909229 RepID=A0ABY8QV31_9MICO|nr:cation:proton antiporter [Brevibacteriaceae bacterium ZFBP1038]
MSENDIVLLLVVIGAVAVTAYARKVGWQAPLLVVILGLGVSAIPVIPRLEVSPELILGIVLPPLLYSTALNFSVPNFKRNLRPILSLGVVLIAVSTIVLGVASSYLVPQLTLATGLVLAAVVAPPDAVTAAAIGRRLGLPRRLMSILTGESLVNDAAALTLFTVTTAAVVGEHPLIENPVLFFVYGAVVGLLVGLVLAGLVTWVRSRLDDPTVEAVLGALVPFAAYLSAEELNGSGVIAVITAGFALGHNAARSGFATRLQERYIWNAVDLVLEAFVFAYIGLQLRFVFADVEAAGEPIGSTLLAAGFVLIAVLLIRILWVAQMGIVSRVVLYWSRRQAARWKPGTWWHNLALRARRNTRATTLGWKENVVLSWTGMRGVVTLAAAAGIPATTLGGGDFPGRAVIQMVAFVVAVGTLLIQGLTLPFLIRKLRLDDPAEAEHDRAQRRHADAVNARAARETLDAIRKSPPPGVEQKVIDKIAERLSQSIHVRQALDLDEMSAERTSERLHALQLMHNLRRRTAKAQRQALIAERDAGRLDDEAMRAALERLDASEAAAYTQSIDRL